VGEKVVHWVHGPGEIVQLDEKILSGHTILYYVVQAGDLTVYVPVENGDQNSLRAPTPACDFKKLFAIITSPGEALADDRLQRKLDLTERMRDGSLDSVCRVIRDLAQRSHTTRLNDHDIATMERAQNFLLREWSLSLSIPPTQAEQELQRLLKISH
jgi:RNA polymerase-interacting CarD/CdnL/TRCF family regulator